MVNCAYVVVPFERLGSTLRASKVVMCDAPAQARLVAEQFAPRVAGVAIVQRDSDPETGDEQDTVLVEIGAVPPSFPAGANWSVRLN